MNRRGLPPGPGFGLAQKIAYARDPIGFIDRCRQRYGPIFTMRNMIGTVVMTTDPGHARAILSAPRKSYGVSTVKLLSPLLGENSLILTEGDRHLRDRKQLMPLFTGRALAAYQDRVCAIAAKEAARASRADAVIIQDVMQDISLRVIIETVFGATDTDRAEALIAAVKDRIAASSPIFVFLPASRQRFFGLTPWDRFRAASDRLESLLLVEIRRNRNPDPANDSVLARLASGREGHIGDRVLCDQLLTLLLAGHDTTASASAWAFDWLHRDADLLERVRAELDRIGDDPDALAGSELLEAVCLETLRLSPVIPDIVRHLRVPLDIGGWHLPESINVGICTVLLQRDPSLYPDPLRFDPDRFIGARVDAHSFLPFGGGTRKCIGAAFAVQEMKLILGTFLTRNRLRSSAPVGHRTQAVRNHFTMGPKGGVRLISA